MKKFTKIIIAIILIATIAVTAVACAKKDANGLYILKAPKIAFSAGNTIEWKPIKNATGYGVVITSDGNDLEEEVITNNTYTLSIDKKVNVKIRAIGDGKKYTNSEYSSALEFDPPVALTSPDGVTLAEQTDKTIKVTWKAVEGATDYSVTMTLNGKLSQPAVVTNATETVFATTLFAEAGEYLFYIKALGDGGKVLDSKPSESVAYTVIKQLADPTKAVLTAADTSATISFNKVEYADRYIIRALRDGVEYKQSESVTIGSDIVSLDLSKFEFKDAGIYTFQVKAARKLGSTYYKESAWVSVNLKTDESKLCEMKLYPAPTNLTLSAEDILSWDAVEGAPKYTVEIKSNSNTYTDTVDKKGDAAERLTYDLTKSNNLIGEGAENRAGGKVVYMNVYVPENLKEGILKGLATTDDISYQSYIEPTKDSNGYYEVKNLMHLAYMAKAPSAKYKLVNDINASNSYFFGLGGNFSGEFDGNGKTLRNFNLVPTKDSDNVSFFGKVMQGATIKNLLIVDCKIDIKNFTYLKNKKVNAAYIAIENNGLIDNVNISSTVSTSSSATPSVATEGAFGGIALVNNATISNSATSFIASAHGAIGGITAINNGKLFNVRVYGSILKTEAIMSLEGEVTNSIYDARVAVGGGIAAINNGEIAYSGMQENATITATASGKEYKACAGGLVGYMTDGKITNSYVSRLSSSGSPNAIVANNSSASNPDNSSFSGGFIGVLKKGTIDHCYNHFVGAKATGTVGGFAGKVEAEGVIKDGYTLTSGKIVARVIGGAVGVNEGTFTNFYYGKYETAKDKDIKASAAGNVAGVNDVVKGEEMMKLNIEGFMLNDKVINHMILASVPYFDKEFNFRSGSTSKNEERKNISKAYIGQTIIDKPTDVMSTEFSGFGTDKYTIASGDITFVISRVIQIA